MKNSLVFTLAVASQLAAGTVSAQSSGKSAQGSGKNVTILRVAGPQLGVRLEEVDKDVVTRLKLKEEKGALVTEVFEKSAAAKAGLLKDDVIVKFQGEAVLTAAQLSRLVREVPSGRKVNIDLVRAGGPLMVTATLERGEWSGKGMDLPELEGLGEHLAEKLGSLEAPKWRQRMEGGPRTFSFKLDEDAHSPMARSGSGRGRLGIAYSEIDGQLAAYFKAPGKSAILVNSVVEGSPAQKAGIKAGDLVIKMGAASVEDGSDLQEVVGDLEPGKPTALTVWRDGRSVDLSVTLDPEEKERVAAPRRRRPVS